MCGIVGFYSREGKSSQVLEAMASSVQHRGPNDEGYFGVSLDGKIFRWKKPGEVKAQLRVGMAFRRLAILDLSEAGAQPMSSADGQHWICFNGEIYNYLELRNTLSDRQFSSTGDTQVLLALLESRGRKALSELNGIFAFSWYDIQNQRLTLVRDPLGIKPLYYEPHETEIFFSSEIRGLRAASTRSSRLRASLLSRHLLNQWLPEPDTLYEGIYRLEPGTSLEIGASFKPGDSLGVESPLKPGDSLGVESPLKPGNSIESHSFLKTQSSTYWDFAFHPVELSEAAWEDRLSQALKHTIDRQLRSDVPVAFFLSGGVDSSLLAAAAVGARRESFTAYTVGFSWSKNKTDQLDLVSARSVAKALGLKHQELILSPDVLSILPKVIETLEEPLADPAAICSYLICEAAASDYRVLISGQGADELFGGYGWYQNAKLTKYFQILPDTLLSGLKLGVDSIPYSLGGRAQQKIHRLQKFFHLLQKPWPQSLFSLRGIFTEGDFEKLFTKSVREIQREAYEHHLKIWNRAKDWSVSEQALYLDLKTYLCADNLFYSDKTSMAHGIELRVPFLDQEMVTLAAELPLRYKLDWRQNKILLKRLAEKHLPREVIYRKKTGFGLPIRDWLRHELKPLLESLLHPATLEDERLFEPKIVCQWIEEHTHGKRDHSAKLYALMSFQLWKNKSGVRWG